MMVWKNLRVFVKCLGCTLPKNAILASEDLWIEILSHLNLILVVTGILAGW